MSALTALRSCSARVAPFSNVQRSAAPRPARSVVVAAKPGLHPEFFEESPVICNGVEVMKVGGTKPKYNVDIYSGNHPFYQGNKTFLRVDDGQLNKFKKRFAELDLQQAELKGPPGMLKMEAVAKKNKGKKK